ncbi:MAG: hypothetical protein WC490_03130 [Candidatus Margulisiibacteriota bacterium]
MITSNKQALLLNFVQSEGRVCPMPTYWNGLYQMLPDCKQLPSGGWEPALPLILAAWGDTPALMKMLRLKEHIDYAAEKGVLDKVDSYLRGLKPDQWAYGDGTTEWAKYKKQNI